jgi:hypothetical protein
MLQWSREIHGKSHPALNSEQAPTVSYIGDIGQNWAVIGYPMPLKSFRINHL